MKKLAKRSFKGIDYIRLASLPQQQADALVKALNPRTLIKIQMYDEVVEDCVLYEVYEAWHSKLIKEVADETSVVNLENTVSLT